MNYLVLNLFGFLLLKLCGGFGYTFISGALDAWVSDETKNQDIELTYIKGNSMSKWMTILGILGALAFGVIDIRLPMFIGALLFIITSFFLTFMMKETVKPEKIMHSMVHQFRLGVKHIFKHPLLRIFVMTAFFIRSI